MQRKAIQIFDKNVFYKMDTLTTRKILKFRRTETGTFYTPHEMPLNFFNWMLNTTWTQIQATNWLRNLHGCPLNKNYVLNHAWLGKTWQKAYYFWKLVQQRKRFCHVNFRKNRQVSTSQPKIWNLSNFHDLSEFILI